MWKLIKLEWKKNNIKKYIGKAAAITVILFLMILLTSGELTEKETVETYGKSMIDAAIEIFANMAFMLCTSVMLASFIVSAYRNKTMDLMFSYPIKRRKILFSQMAAVWIFNFCALVLSKLMIYGGLFLINRLMHTTISGISSGEIFANASFYLELLINSAAMVSISYTVLLASMRVKSTKATIVASCIVILLTQGNIGSYTLINNILFYIVLAVIAAITVFLYTYNVETKDVA